jgi:phospholipid transport system substrate-binding protein
MIACRSLAALALVLGTATLAAAGEPTERLRTFFERANGVILAPESEGSADARVAAVRALVTEVFDVDGAAALALGRRWETLAPPARATFTRLYADVVERAYLAWVGSKARVGEGGVSVRWLEELVDGDAAAVRSVLLTRAGGELPIDYRLVRREGDWLVRDVVVDGVSLAANYRVQFERVLQLGSYDELLARLRDKAGPAARGETIRAMAVPSPMGPLREEIAAPQTSRTATLVVAEIRDRRNAIVSDAPDVVATDARLSALVPPAPEPTAGTASPRATVAVSLDPARPRAASAVSLDPARPRSASAVSLPTSRADAPPAPPQFWVQVGAFRTIDAAAQLVRRLRDHAVTIAIGGDRPAPLTRVLVGPFADRSAAVSVVRALHASGFAAFIPE